MALAYVILAHKNPSQVARLFRNIYHPEDLLILHADIRSDLSLKKLFESLSKEYPNVRVLRPRPVIWGGYSIPKVQLTAIEVALREKQKWSHFINLSGQDFPLKSRSTIINHFEKHANNSFVSWFDPFETRIWANAAERINRYHIESPLLHRMLAIRGIGRRINALAGWTGSFPHIPILRRPPPPFKYFGGANHVALSREGCAYLQSSAESIAIQKWLRLTAIPDEAVFQSVLLNGELANSLINNDLREINFPIGAPSPKIWRSSDAERLLTSKNLWARKFDTEIDSEILSIIEKARGIS